MKKGFAFIFLVALLPLTALAMKPPALPEENASTAEPEYAPAGECIVCHADQAEGITRTHHGKRAFEEKTALACQSCHGPAALHLEDPEIKANQPLLIARGPREIAATCRQCHSGGGHMFWEGGRHADAGVTCTDCHSVHSPVSDHNLLKSDTVMETCFGCHMDVRADTMKSSHHPIREGLLSCADCHDSHGTPNDNNIAANSVNELCYQCHAEKRGPFIWEHAPVRENCLNCHTPHGSNHQKLQITSNPYLCQQCHLNTRHPSGIFDASSLPGPAGTNRAFERGCVNCHSAIHGSNHPSGPYLGR